MGHFRQLQSQCSLSKLAQNLWVKRYGGPQLSQQGLFFSRQNHFRGHGKSIYTHSKTTFHHGEIILANLLTCHQHAKCYGNNPTCPALSLSSQWWNFFSLPIQVTILIRTHVLTLIVSAFSPYFSVLFTIKTISYLENVRSLIFFFFSLSFLHSNGQASVSFKLKFSKIFWKSVLDLQLAMENGTLLGYPGVRDEASCQTGSHKCKLAIVTSVIYYFIIYSHYWVLIGAIDQHMWIVLIKL